MRTLLAALAGFLTVGGLILTISSIRPVPVKPPKPRAGWMADPMLKRRTLTALGTAAVVLLFTRWPVAAVGVGAISWTVAGRSPVKHRKQIERRTEAIALWAEMLRDAIGTSRGVEGVLVATAASGPLPIRPELETMARRIQHEPLGVVLDGLAEDLAHPLGDLVVTALRLTAKAGGGQVRDVLDSVAVAAYAEAESHRRIEVAREGPRSAMKYTAIVVAGFITLVTLLARRYLRPYDTVTGQVVLMLVALYWALGFWWMTKMSRPNPTTRLTSPTAETGR